MYPYTNLCRVGSTSFLCRADSMSVGAYCVGGPAAAYACCCGLEPKIPCWASALVGPEGGRANCCVGYGHGRAQWGIHPHSIHGEVGCHFCTGTCCVSLELRPPPARRLPPPLLELRPTPCFFPPPKPKFLLLFFPLPEPRWWWWDPEFITRLHQNHEPPWLLALPHSSHPRPFL